MRWDENDEKPTRTPYYAPSLGQIRFTTIHYMRRIEATVSIQKTSGSIGTTLRTGRIRRSTKKRPDQGSRASAIILSIEGPGDKKKAHLNGNVSVSGATTNCPQETRSRTVKECTAFPQACGYRVKTVLLLVSNE